MSGSNKKIWLKVKCNLLVISHTLSTNLWLVRVHEFVAREISLLRSQNLPLWIATSPMRAVPANMEDPQEKPRPQALAKFARVFGRSLGARANFEKSRTAQWSYGSSFGTPVSSGAAPVCSAPSRFALGKRTFGFGLGRTLLPLSRKRLGLVCDGGQAVPSKSRRLPGSCSVAGQREHEGLVSGIHYDPHLHTQTHPGLGLRRDFRHYQARQEPALDRAALPFSSHQPLAKLPRPTQPQVGWQIPARSALSADSQSSRAPRRSPFANRAQKTEAPRSQSDRIARHPHDRSGVSETDRPFQSLSEISKTESADYYRQRRSYEPKS